MAERTVVSDEEFEFNAPAFAEEIMSEHKFVTHMESEEIYVYEGGVYKNKGEQIIRARAQELLESNTTTHRVNEIVEFIRRATYTPKELFNSPPPNLVCVENGILNVETGELMPHTPDLIFLSKLPVKWDPNAQCPTIVRFLEEVVPDETDRKILLEFVGYCLYRQYHIHKALMLVGGGSNGKSTFIKLVQRLLGRDNVANRSLQELVEDRFAAADLFGKLANLFYDLPSAALTDTGAFKGLTGGDTVKGEKKFKSAFSFDNYAKLIFSANQIPRVRGDYSDAFFRRWIIINFPNKFEGERADKNLLEKLTTLEELSGFLKLAVAHLRGLLERGDFSYSKTVDEIRQEYIRKSDPVGAFAQDCLLISPNHAIEKKLLYTVFCEYCRAMKFTPPADVTFYKRLNKHVSFSEERITLHGERRRAFVGFKFNEDLVTVQPVQDVQGRYYLIYNATFKDDGGEGEERGEEVEENKEKKNPGHLGHPGQKDLAFYADSATPILTLFNDILRELIGEFQGYAFPMNVVVRRCLARGIDRPFTLIEEEKKRGRLLEHPDGKIEVIRRG